MWQACALQFPRGGDSQKGGDVEGMLAKLEPLHEMMARGPDTLCEVAFQQKFGSRLQEAKDWIERYKARSVPAVPSLPSIPSTPLSFSLLCVGVVATAPKNITMHDLESFLSHAIPSHQATGSDGDLHRAWNIYHAEFQTIDKIIKLSAKKHARPPSLPSDITREWLLFLLILQGNGLSSF